MSFQLIVLMLGALSSLTPCMWNLSLILRAYTLKEGYRNLFLFSITRLALLNIIALVASLFSESINPSRQTLFLAHTLIALFLLIGLPLIKRVGFAPVDLSPQFLLKKLKLPAGVSLGLSIPYCSIPFLVLIFLYSPYSGESFVYFNLYGALSTLVLTSVVLIPETFLRKTSALTPLIPSVAGLTILLLGGAFLDLTEVKLFISSLLQDKPSLLLLAVFMFLLGFLTSLGPSTLPFLYVVFSLLVLKPESKKHIFTKVLGFVIAFLLSHSIVGAVASLGLFTLNDLFKTELFNLFIVVVLLIVALSLLRVLSIPVELSRLNFLSNPTSSGFLIGFAYTFSMCPSCTSLFLGAVILSASFGDHLVSAFLMSLYALGRTVPIFLSGAVVGFAIGFLKENYAFLKNVVAVIFLLLSGYFFKNFLEVVL